VAIGNGCRSEGVVNFVCAQAGCPDCLETLLRENKGRIQSVIRQQWMIGIKFVDLVQEGRIGLWEAFSSFAWAIIRYRLWNARAYADRAPDDGAEAWLELED
jgi:hypothetical protein